MAGGAQVKSSLSINTRYISSRFPHKVSRGAMHARDKSRRGRKRRFVNDNGHGYCSPLGEKERESCMASFAGCAHNMCTRPDVTRRLYRESNATQREYLPATQEFRISSSWNNDPGLLSEPIIISLGLRWAPQGVFVFRPRTVAPILRVSISH